MSQAKSRCKCTEGQTEYRKGIGIQAAESAAVRRYMFKTILVISIIVVALILFMPLLLVMMIYRHFDPMGAHRITQPLGAFFMKLLVRCTGSKVTVRGLENIPNDTPVLFISNHRGYFDIFLGYGWVKKPYGWIAKKEFWDQLYVVRRWMLILHNIFLKRHDAQAGLEMINQSVEYIKQGCSMWICPEGTRNRKPGRISLLMFHNGSFKIAAKAGVPVVPVAIYGTREIMEDHLPRLTAGNLVMEIGKPQYITDLSVEDRKNVGDYFHDIVADMLLKIDIEMGYGEEGRYE